MKALIKEKLGNPAELESLFRENKSEFKRSFLEVYPEIEDNLIAQAWNERLKSQNTGIQWGGLNELLIVFLSSIFAFILARLPDITNIDDSFYYSRNLSFTVFPLLGAYFVWKQNLKLKSWIVPAIILIISVIYINLLPEEEWNDSIFLALIHMPFMLWLMVGFLYSGGWKTEYSRRIEFLKYNGDLLVLITILLIAGAILTALTLGLFSIIKVDITEFYFKNIVVWGMVAAPLIATYLIRVNPGLVSKVSPIIAQLFTPLVLITLSVYFFAMPGSGEDPFRDRDFLLMFNIMLIGVMAILLFSLTEWISSSRKKFGSIILFALVIQALLVNAVALSAILFRIGEWGITPNRLAVLGGNGLIFTNLAIICFHLFKSIKGESPVEKIEKSIAGFLPLYFGWFVIVIFTFPIVFGLL
jgi:hypothetical protein